MLKLFVKEGQQVEETEVLIHCVKRDAKVIRIENYVNQISKTVNAALDDTVYKLSAEQILYIESVERKTFLYTKDDVYQSEEALYRLEQNLNRTGIVRISKNCLVNVDALRSIRPLTNQRFEATLVNDEKLVVSRKYISELKKTLEM